MLGCKVPLVPSSHTQNLYVIKDTIQSDTVSAIERMLKPYRDSLSGIMNEVIGQASDDFKKEKGGGSLGNFVADAVYSRAKQLDPLCSAAIYNPGGIRIPEIKKGNITRGKMFELLPFENELVIIDVKGDTLEKWLNAIGEAGGWPISSIWKVQFDVNKKINSIASDTTMVEMPDGNLKTILTMKSVVQDSIYHIATNDYIANGGDNCDFLKGLKRLNTGVLIRDLLIDEVKTNQIISPDNSSRIHFDKK